MSHIYGMPLLFLMVYNSVQRTVCEVENAPLLHRYTTMQNSLGSAYVMLATSRVLTWIYEVGSHNHS